MVSLKDEGNNAFKAGLYEKAEEIYSKALNEITKNSNLQTATLLSNRAAARLQIKNYQGALQDASESIKIFSLNAKAYYRKSLALEKLSRFQSALDTAVYAKKTFFPNTTNAEFKQLIDRLQNELHISSTHPVANGKRVSLSLYKNAIQSALSQSKGLFKNAPFEFILPHEDSVCNVLILLHGLGDTPPSYTKFGRALSLPQTACISLGAPHIIPFTENNDGRSWFTVFDDQTMELIEGRKGEKRRQDSLEHTVRDLHVVLSNIQHAFDHIHEETGTNMLVTTNPLKGDIKQMDDATQNIEIKKKIKSVRFHVFGYSQGGTVAVSLLLSRINTIQRTVNIASCVAVSSGLLEEQLREALLDDDDDDTSCNQDTLPAHPSLSSSSCSITTAKTDVLLIHGDCDKIVPPSRVVATEKALLLDSKNRNSHIGRIERYCIRGKSHSMLSSEEESKIFMEFLSRYIHQIPLKSNQQSVDGGEDEDATLIELTSS